MRVKEIIDFAFVQTGQGRVSEIQTDQWNHALTALNIAYLKVWQMFPWQGEKEIELEVTSVLGSLILPNYLESVRAARIGNVPLRVLDENLLSREDPGGLGRTNATTYGYMWAEPQAVLTQPSVAGAVRIKSGSTSDTTGTVRIHGLVAGVDTYEDLTLNGTTNVDGSKAFSYIRRIVKPTTVGRITVLDTSDNEFGTIAPWHSQPEYQHLLLIPTPTENKTVTIQSLRKYQPLVDANDGIWPSMLEPAVLHWLMATMYMRAKQPGLAQVEQQNAGEALKIAGNRENEINDKEWRVAPDFGMFGDLGHTEHTQGWPFYATY